MLTTFPLIFSALQECATDSEELVGGIYPMRAASVCSAPPDLLLSSEHMTTSTYSTASPVGGKCPLRIRAHNQHKDQMKASLEGQNHSRSNRNSTNHSNESHDSNRVRLEVSLSARVECKKDFNNFFFIRNLLVTSQWKIAERNHSQSNFPSLCMIWMDMEKLPKM